jgi:acyl-CoA reductase-like NAD-dependent aldehyde dehydrogenase
MPVVTVIAAGNRVMLKPSKFAPATNAVPASMISEIFPDPQHRPSLALTNRRSRSKGQHWTAATIDDHLVPDTLVMRRSGVRSPRRLSA